MNTLMNRLNRILASIVTSPLKLLFVCWLAICVYPSVYEWLIYRRANGERYEPGQAFCPHATPNRTKEMIRLSRNPGWYKDEQKLRRYDRLMKERNEYLRQLSPDEAEQPWELLNKRERPDKK